MPGKKKGAANDPGINAHLLRSIPLLIGFTAAVGQIVLMREVIVLFNGNELSMGLVLAAWLIWTAAGSGATGWLTRNRPGIRKIAASILCIWGLSLPLAICALRYSRIFLQSVPGESLGPTRTAIVSFVCISAFCFLSGSLFALAAQMLRQTFEISPALASSSAYLLETAGSALGGVFASILLLRFFGCMQIAALIGFLCLWIGITLFAKTRGGLITISAGTVLAAAFVLMYVAPQIEKATLQHLWPGFHLLTSRDSMYGRLTVIGAGGMRSIYQDGSILANIPDPAAAEESIHYAMLEHPAPRNVLLIGNGVNGSITEALKHPALERLDYVEIDPELIAIYRRLFPREAAQSFSDPRVHVHNMDGRRFLQLTSGRFDVIIINVPDPANAQLNRFYTAEFFRIVRKHLARGGVLALSLRSSEEYISPDLAAFLSCMQRTLYSVFPRVVVIPGETLHFFAAAAPGALTGDPQMLMARLKGRNLHTQYVREYFIPFRMTPDRMEQIRELLKPRAGTPINQDFHPVSYYFSTVLWSSQFGDSYTRLLEKAQNVSLRPLLVAVVAVSLAIIAILTAFLSPQTRSRATAALCVTAGGYTLMTLQILLLLAFQSIFGYVYRELALLIGMFMGGIAAGAWLGIHYARSRHRASLVRAATLNQILLAASAPLLLAFVYLLSQSLHAAGTLAMLQAAFPVLALLCGIPGGFQFPVASAIYLEGRAADTSLATLYALDLVGGCAGALVLAGFLIPVFGFWIVAWLTAAISLAPIALAARASFQPAV